MAVRGVRGCYREAEPSSPLVSLNSLHTILYFSQSQRFEPSMNKTNHLKTLSVNKSGKQALIFFKADLQLLLSSKLAATRPRDATRHNSSETNGIKKCETTTRQQWAGKVEEMDHVLGERR